MDFSKYENKLPWPKGKDARIAYYQETARLKEVFKQDLFAEFGVSENPKREKAFYIAWDKGHSAGLQEVYFEFEELVELIE